jgi:RimJ/RimL family protein N-acetyltransferase
VPQATLHTERLTLAPLAEEHLTFLVDMNADPEVMRYLHPTGLTPEESEARMRRTIARSATYDGLGMWVGHDDGVPIGLWMLQPPTQPHHPSGAGIAELGYRLPQRHWRLGYATEGSRELVRHGFEDLGLTGVFAQTMAVNTASRATMAAVGLTYVRTFDLHEELPVPGHEHGEVEYDLTRDRWSAQG